MAHEKHMGVPHSDMTPGAIADLRTGIIADGTADHLERITFMAEFGRTLYVTREGHDTYHHWRAIQADSFKVAGYLEAVAAARREGV